jgi:hypothetical protein
MDSTPLGLLTCIERGTHPDLPAKFPIITTAIDSPRDKKALDRCAAFLKEKIIKSLRFPRLA